MASKNLQRAYTIYKQIEAGGDRQPSQNDIAFLKRFRKRHGQEFDAYVKQQEAQKKVATTDFSKTKDTMQKSHEIRTSEPKPASSNPEGSKETQSTAKQIKDNTRNIRVNAATWRGIDAAIKDGAIDGTKVKELEAKGDQKKAYELGVKLVKEFQRDANKILDTGEKLQVDGIYGRKSKAAFVKYNEAKQAFAGDDESANPDLKAASTGDRYQRRRAYSYSLNDDEPKTHSDSLRLAQRDRDYASLDSIRNNPEFLAGLTIDSTARFNNDNAYIIPNIGRDGSRLDSAVYTPRGQYIDYSSGTQRMPNDTVYSRHPIVIGSESYEPYLDHDYVGRRGGMLYTPIYQNNRMRQDTTGLVGYIDDALTELYPVDNTPGLYTDMYPIHTDSYAFYNSFPLLDTDSKGYIHPDTMLAHPELIEQARMAAEARAAQDTIGPIYLNMRRKGGLLKKRCKK